MTYLDEKALAAKAWADLEMAASATGDLEVARITLPIEKVRALINERSALPSSPVSELVERLENRARTKNGAGEGAYDVGYYEVFAAADDREAASTLTTLSTRNAELEAENARLKRLCAGLHDEVQFMREKAVTNGQQHRAAEARLVEALKALEPFAEQADNPQWWNDSSIRREHLHAARRVREGGKVDG